MFISLVVVWLGAACGRPPGPASSPSSATGGPAQPARTLIAAVQAEPRTLSGRNIAQGSTSQQFPKRLFNADLALLDDQSNPQPYLAEALPQLHTDSWKVFPDGRMETTYRLRPNLVWHDGTPHTADDFVFSWQVFATPELGSANTLPIRLVASVEAPDNRTVLIRWTEPNAVARALQSLGSSGGSNGLPPLPRFILGPALESGVEALINHSYWNQDYVGLGPYRLDRWEPGAFIEASAFDRHALGAPKIQRIKILFFTDPGTALAAMLSGDAHLATDTALTASHAATLMRQWPAGSGYQVPYYGTWLSAHFQGRPELLSPPALQDRRVRQALAHAVDRPGLNEAIYVGQYVIADSSFAPTSEVGRAADAAAVRYPFDLARSGQIMAEAGFIRRLGDELYIGLGGERLSLELKSSDGQDEPLRTAMASNWRQAGFDVREAIIPSRLATNLEVKSQYPGLYIGATSEGERGVGAMSSENIPTAQNNWRGSGVGFAGYSNPELDRLVAAFGRSLDPADRSRLAADIAKLWSTDLPAIHLFFTVSSQVFSSDVKGPQQRPASSSIHWNVYEWELR